MSPEIAILVSTFERPGHLRRVLASIAGQRGASGQMEVVVTDDGSRDETARIVREFVNEVDFPVRMTTHPHDGFRLAQCRNEGVAASTAPYLLFIDGDCLLPPDHVRTHLDCRRPGVVYAGYCVHLDEPTSATIDAVAARAGQFTSLATWAERWKLLTMDLSARFYSLIGHAEKPKLFGGNIGIARTDYERVNGYDENFVGWGCEDDDLRLRLRKAGVRIESILGWTCTYHLWHPKTPTAPQTWKQGANVAYLQRPARLTRCANGLVKRRLEDLRVFMPGPLQLDDPARWTGPGNATVPEIEILLTSSGRRFSGTADVNLLVARTGAPDPQMLAEAHLLLSDQPIAHFPAERTFPLNELDLAIRSTMMPLTSQPIRRAA